MSRTYRIGELAKRFGLTLRAIRFYEQKGLIQPERSFRQRIFSEDDASRLEKIVRWTRAGLPLVEVGVVLDLLDRKNDEVNESVKSFLQARLTELEQQFERRREAIEELRKEAA